MILPSSLDYWVHAVVAGLILLGQLILLFRDDAPAFHMAEYSSMVGITSVLLLVILHVTQGVRVTQGKKEGSASKMARNLLVAVALSSEFSALALDRESSSPMSSIVWPVIMLSSLSAMRILDSLLDAHDDISKSVSVQDVQDPFNIRVITIHVLMLLSLGAQIIKRIHWSEETNGLSVSESVDTLDVISIVLLSVHLAVHPLNVLLRWTGFDKMLIKLVCCMRQEEGQDSDDLELLSITRVPVIRHTIAGVIIAANGYVLGAAYMKDELTWQIPAVLFYLASDAVGRNYL